MSKPNVALLQVSLCFDAPGTPGSSGISLLYFLRGQEKCILNI